MLVDNKVSYADFNDYQKPIVDYLIKLDVLESIGTRVRFVNSEQFFIFESLFRTKTVSYYHLSKAGRAQVDLMFNRGWVRFCSSLLCEAEASYFNYYLNKSEFSNGLDLRNRYVHGSQVKHKDDELHFTNYIITLRIIIALVIKINDDFALSSKENASN